MPIMQVFRNEGRTKEQKLRLIVALVNTAVESIGAPYATVRVLTTEMSKAHFGIGGETANELGR